MRALEHTTSVLVSRADSVNFGILVFGGEGAADDKLNSRVDGEGAQK